MAAKVRELIEELVWSDITFPDLSHQVKKILFAHVWPIIMPARVMEELHEWVSEQTLSYDAKKSKINAILAEMSAPDSAGVIMLRDHHWRIAKNYYTVSVETALFFEKI